MSVYIVILEDSNTDVTVKVFAKKADADKYAAKERGVWENVTVQEKTVN